MTRRIAIRTKTEVRFYDLKSNERPATLVGKMLYRTDEAFMLPSRTENEEFCLYDHNGIYPYAVQDPPAPDETMAYIDIIKSAEKKLGKVSTWPKWLNWNTMVYAILGAVVVYYLAKTYL